MLCMSASFLSKPANTLRQPITLYIRTIAVSRFETSLSHPTTTKQLLMSIAKLMWLLIYIAVCSAVRDDEHLSLCEKMLNDLGLEFESDPEPRLRVLFFLLLKLIQHQPTQQAWSTESCCSASKSEHYSGTATDYPIKTLS